METPEEVATAVAGLAELIEEIPGQARNDEEGQAGNDEEEPVPEPMPVEEIPGQVGNDGEEQVEEIPDQVGNDEAEKVGNDEAEKIGNDEAEKIGNDEVKPKKSHREFWRGVLIVLCVLVGLLVVFVLLSRLAPGLLDPLLYSREELQILRY